MLITLIVTVVIALFAIFLSYGIGAKTQYDKIFKTSINVITETDKFNPERITFIGISYSTDSVCAKVIKQIDASDEVSLKDLRNDLNDLYIERNSSDAKTDKYSVGYRNGQIRLLEKIFNLEDSVKDEGTN